MPCRLITNSPGMLPAAEVAITDFSGAPAKRSRKLSLHETSKPQFAGLNGAISNRQN